MCGKVCPFIEVRGAHRQEFGAGANRSWTETYSPSVVA